MSAFGLISAPYQTVVSAVLLIMLVGGSATLAWRIQDWRYAGQLEEQARLHDETLNRLARFNAQLEGPGLLLCRTALLEAYLERPNHASHALPCTTAGAANAQRIIAITDAGDRGLIALQACQACVRALAH